MWTPKRVLLLGLGIVVFLFGYGIYAFFLGAIDGIPPLPEDLFPGEIVLGSSNVQESDVDHKLKIAFGDSCTQVKKRFKFEVRKKATVIAAAEVKTDEPDGRVKLTDFSCALFKESAEDKSKYPEINTVTSDFAFLTFDQPITNALDMNKAKPVGVELRGNINIINNHATEKKEDDLEIRVDSQPLFYDERTSRIWSEGYVKLIDKKTQPDPTMISGQGLEMLLTKDTPSDKKETARSKTKNDGLSGVDTIILKSTVRMDLYPGADSGFPAASGESKAAANAKKKPAQRSHVVILTQGQFLFDVVKDVAHFASPAPAKANESYPDQVEVIRELLKDPPDAVPGQSYDRLYCDHLTLKFSRKTEPGPTHDKEKGGGGREIESAHATAKAGMEVVVSLDTENLAAYCAELFYECPTPDRGSRTTLKGDPVQAAKDGHKIKCRELMLVSANEKGIGQHVVAKGPGIVDLFDRDPAKGYTTHALWKGLLTQNKYKEGDVDLDLLTLTEDAVFIDDEHSQKLYGQRLQVWLEPVETPAKATSADPASQKVADGPHQQVKKVEGQERVKADGPEFRIQQCRTLKIRIKNGVSGPEGMLPAAEDKAAPATDPPAEPQAPSPSQAARLPDQVVVQQPPSLPARPGATLQTPTPAAPKQAAKTNKDSGKPKQPIDIWANDITIDVLRNGEKNDLQELVAIGKVHVHQDGEKEGDKGVDIKGDMLDLLHFADGDILKVFGTAGNAVPAALQLGELFLQGPQVMIDQRANTAAVEGLGSMNMPSNTTFDGGKPTKPGTRITIHWTRNMFFNGQDADYFGGVTAYQDNSSLQSSTLQVALDHKVSLKEGQKAGNEAKVEKVVAHNNVVVIDVVKDEKDKDKNQSVRRLEARQMQVDNVINSINATGPGKASALQYGTEDVLGETGKKQTKTATPTAAKASDKTPQLMLTRIFFQDRLYSAPLANSPSTRQSKFYGNVLAIQVPADDLDVTIDPGKLPKGGMMIQCEVLTVQSKQMPDQKAQQEMRGERKVCCWNGTDMSARADVVTFSEASNIVTFEGTPGNPATVYQIIGGQGGQPRTTTAGKILYNRDTGAVRVDDGRSIDSWLEPGPSDRAVALLR